MNAAVASYIAVLVSAVVITWVSLHRFKQLKDAPFPRDYKPAMLSAIISMAWIVVSINGIAVKWYNPGARLSVDTPIFALLICVTLFTLAITLRATHRVRVYNEIK